MIGSPVGSRWGLRVAVVSRFKGYNTGCKARITTRHPNVFYRLLAKVLLTECIEMYYLDLRILSKTNQYD